MPSVEKNNSLFICITPIKCSSFFCVQIWDDARNQKFPEGFPQNFPLEVHQHYFFHFVHETVFSPQGRRGGQSFLMLSNRTVVRLRYGALGEIRGQNRTKTLDVKQDRWLVGKKIDFVSSPRSGHWEGNRVRWSLKDTGGIHLYHKVLFVADPNH